VAIDYDEPVLRFPLSRIIQTDGDGKCFAACVASILGMHFEDVPNFCAMPPDWWNRFQIWLCQRGLFAVEIKLIEHSISQLPHGIPVILSGKSPRGLLHSVVALTAAADGFTLEHDPHPSGEFFGGAEPTEALFIVRHPLGQIGTSPIEPSHSKR